jgi:polysaccharide biosynthesis protein PslH
MKVLWVNSNFMHPTTKGGQIRTLEMLRHLHRWHEIHYVSIANPAQPEGPARAHEYSTRSYPFPYRIPQKTSPAFWVQLAAGLFSPTPLAVSRFNPPGMRVFLEDLIRKEAFECAVVDHLAPTSYFPDLPHAIFFQHNVETVIWRRHVEHASDRVRRWYFGLQAARMFEYERRVSLESGHIVAVSRTDADEMRRLFGVTRVSEIPTGVDVQYFRPWGGLQPAAGFSPPAGPEVTGADLVFVGSMDWLPNVDGVMFFVREVLPLIRRRRPETTLAVVGRTPAAKVAQLAAEDSRICVTGTVPDIRPWLWGSAVSIVPLRIGGGTRLKIYEAMAAKIPVVSTTIGAEGLDATPGTHLLVADAPAAFADATAALLRDPDLRRRLAANARRLVEARYSWETIGERLEKIYTDLVARKL